MIRMNEKITLFRKWYDINEIRSWYNTYEEMAYGKEKRRNNK